MHDYLSPILLLSYIFIHTATCKINKPMRTVVPYPVCFHLHLTPSKPILSSQSTITRHCNDKYDVGSHKTKQNKTKQNKQKKKPRTCHMFDMQLCNTCYLLFYRGPTTM